MTRRFLNLTTAIALLSFAIGHGIGLAVSQHGKELSHIDYSSSRDHGRAPRHG